MTDCVHSNYLILFQIIWPVSLPSASPEPIAPTFDACLRNRMAAYWQRTNAGIAAEFDAAVTPADQLVFSGAHAIPNADYAGIYNEAGLMLGKLTAEHTSTLLTRAVKTATTGMQKVASAASKPAVSISAPSLDVILTKGTTAISKFQAAQSKQDESEQKTLAKKVSTESRGLRCSVESDHAPCSRPLSSLVFQWWGKLPSSLTDNWPIPTAQAEVEVDHGLWGMKRAGGLNHWKSAEHAKFLAALDKLFPLYPEKNSPDDALTQVEKTITIAGQTQGVLRTPAMNLARLLAKNFPIRIAEHIQYQLRIQVSP